LCIAPSPWFESCSHNYFGGTHLETVFFSGAVLFLFLRQSPGWPAPGFWQYAALGILCSWAVHFCVQNVPLVATLVVMTLWRHRWRGLYRLAWPAAPLFAFSFGVEWNLSGAAPAVPHDAGSAAAHAQNIVMKLYALFADIFPSFLSFAPSTRSWRGAWRGDFLPDWPEFVVRHVLPWLGNALSPTRDFLLGRVLVLDGEAVTTVISPMYYVVALAGLALAAIAALAPRQGRAANIRLFGTAVVDPPAQRSERPEEKTWLTRFVVVLFAAWVGAYGVSNGRIDVNYSDTFHYLLPIYPVFLAAVCYALSFLPGAVKWLAVLPFLIAGFGDLCGMFARPASLPLETWQEMNAQRGDDYAYFLTDDRQRKWLRDCGKPRDPTYPEACIRKLPRRWRELAWIAYSGGMSLEEADQWRQNPGDFVARLGAGEPAGAGPALVSSGGVGPRIALTPVASLIAMGRGQTFGKKLCCDGRAPLDDLPAGAQRAGSLLDEATASAFVTGIGYGCFQILGDDCDYVHTGFSGQCLTPEEGEEYAPELLHDPAGVSQGLRAVEQRLGMTPRQSWEAFLAGLSMFLGATAQSVDAGRSARICRFWAPAFGVEDLPALECPVSFRQGLAEGEAIVAINHFREVNLRAHPLDSLREFHGDPVDWPLVCEILRRWGVDPTPLPGGARAAERALSGWRLRASDAN
jgi:hypothetical protein